MMSGIDSIEKAFVHSKQFTRLRPGDVFTWFPKEGHIVLARNNEPLTWQADNGQQRLSIQFIKYVSDFELLVKYITWSHGLTVEWASEDVNGAVESHSYRVVEAPRV